MGALLAQYMEVSKGNNIRYVIKKDDSLQGKIFSFLGPYGTSLGHPKSRALHACWSSLSYKKNGSIKVYAREAIQDCKI